MGKAEHDAIAAYVSAYAEPALTALLKRSPDKPTEFQYIDTSAGLPVLADRDAAIRAFQANNGTETIKGDPLKMFSPAAQTALANLILSRKAAGHPHSVDALVTEAIRMFCRDMREQNEREAS